MSKFTPHIKRLSRVLLVLLLLLLAAGLCARYIWHFDILANLFVPLLAAAIICFVAFRRLLGRWIQLISLVVMGLVMIVISPHLSQIEGELSAPDLRIYQLNLRYDNDDSAAILASIRATKPDIITVQERSPVHDAVFDNLAEEYPHIARCVHTVQSVVEIHSHLPFVEAEPGNCADGYKLVWRTVKTPKGLLTVAAYHGRYPLHRLQINQMNSAFEQAGDTFNNERAFVIAGDFNAVPWSRAVQTFAAKANGKISAGYRPSWLPVFISRNLIPIFGLPIDQVIHAQSVNVHVTRGKPASSDHLPLVVDIKLKN